MILKQGIYLQLLSKKAAPSGAAFLSGMIVFL